MNTKEAVIIILLVSVCYALNSNAMEKRSGEIDERNSQNEISIQKVLRALDQSWDEDDVADLARKLSLITMDAYKDYQKLALKKMSITDDRIAQAIKNPTPPSVSDVLYTIRKKNDQQRGLIRVLDLSENNITNEGAGQLFDEILKLLPNLEIIDLSYNRLRDSRGNTENTTFEAALRKILCSSLKLLNLRKNYFGHDWYAHIQQQLGLEIAIKIKIA